MAVSYFYSDKAAQERIQRRQTAAAYRANAVPSEGVAALIAKYQAAYPHMEAGVVLSLASKGVDPASPEAQQIAEMAIEQKRKSGWFDQIGDVLGKVGGLVGKPVGMAARGVDAALGPVDEAIAPTVKGTVRTAMVVLETLGQEYSTFIRAGGYAGVKVQDEQGGGFLRNIMPDRWDDQFEAWKESYADAGSSSGREALMALHRGEDVDLGSGFLPNHDEGIEARVRERANRLSINVGNVRFGGPGNLSITPGRVIAAKVSEPGDQAFNIVSGLVDGGVAWFGDPANAALGAVKTGAGINRAVRGSRALRDGRGLTGAVEELTHLGRFAPIVDRSLQSRAAEAVGGIGDIAGRLPGKGGRNTTIPDLTESWYKKGGRHIVDKLAESDFTEITRATGDQIPVVLRRRLADASTPDEVLAILDGEIGTALMDAPQWKGFRVAPAVHDRLRIMGVMAPNAINPDDLDQAVPGLDAWLRNAKVSKELREASVEKLARTNGREEMIGTLSEIMADTAAEVAVRGVGGKGVRATKEFPTVAARARHLTQMYQDDAEKLRVYALAEIAEDAKVPGVVLGGAGHDLPRPFLWTEHLNSAVPLPDAREMRRATSALGRLVDNPFFEKTVDGIDVLQGVWKRTALMRGAYTVRVIGEEQLRMAASGLDSMFAHPISFIGALLGDPEKARKLIGDAKLGTGKLRQLDATGEFFGGVDELKDGLVKGWTKWDDKTVYDRFHTLFKPGDEGYERAWMSAVGELSHDPVAQRVARASGNLDDVKRWFYSEGGMAHRKKLMGYRPELRERLEADAYIDNMWEIVKQRTMNDTTLLDAVGHGKFGGKAIGAMDDKGKWSFDDGFRGYFNGKLGPEQVKGLRMAQRGGAHPISEAWDNGVGWMFAHLMTKETNYLSRSPSFRQMYWQRIEEMLPHMSDEVRAAALSNAEGVVDAAQLKRMQAAPSFAKKVDAGVADPHAKGLGDFDMLAKKHALNGTKQLLYDASQKSQFFDAMRLVFPFGEAWKEVTTRWAKIGLVENPRVLRRGEQIINGARGNGFFHKDSNDEEVFTMPFSRQVSKALVGVPIDFTGRVAGMSLLTDVFPGVGPAVQVPAAAFLPDGTEFNWARKFISPYGEADYSEGIMESFLPGWAKNVRKALGSGDPRARANAASAMHDYLLSTGDYDISDPTENARLMEDSIHYGSRMFLLRGMAQFFSPTSPMPETLLEGPKGDELLLRRELIKDLRRLTDEAIKQGGTYDDGERAFVERYGVELLGATQSMTKTMTKMLPVSKQSSKWVQDNRDILKDYSKTWGFFAPSDKTEGIDFAEYTRQIDSGDRKPLTLEQRSEEANKKVARYIYGLAEAKVSARPSKVEREWLKAIKEKLDQEYPGYRGMTSGVPFGDDLDKDVIPELRRAIRDPRLAETNQAKAIGLYLQARDKALASAEREFGSKLGSQAATPVREWLRRVARALSSEYREFTPMYDNVFSYELED